MIEIEKGLLAKKKPPQEQLDLLRKTMTMIEADQNPAALQSIEN